MNRSQKVRRLRGRPERRRRKRKETARQTKQTVLQPKSLAGGCSDAGRELNSSATSSLVVWTPEHLLPTVSSFDVFLAPLELMQQQTKPAK